jgi:hypothetical protein
VIWVQLHILRKIQCSIILNLITTSFITEFAKPFLSVQEFFLQNTNLTPFLSETMLMQGKRFLNCDYLR